MRVVQQLAPQGTVEPFRYSAYGLAIDSDVQLPGMLPRSAASDPSRVVFRRLPANAVRANQPFTFEDRGERQILTWSEVGTFTIATAAHVDAEPTRGASDDLIALPLLGSVMAALLHRRGTFVLHASAVCVGGTAVALVGDKGAGKSTTSALLVAGGHPLLADDIAALDLGTGAPHVLPAGSNEMKLWPESLSVLRGFGLGPGRTWHHEIDKASYDLGSHVATEPAPLGALNVLSRGAAAEIAPMNLPDAVAALLRFSYQARYGEAGFGRRLAELFAQSASLAAQGLVLHLAVPDGLDRAQDIVAHIEDDLRQSGR